ncbi:translation elongation factor Ts [Blattabacterium cuenoti]|uniref:translation elongation factor Ts n=1 Tax=Blattabacterium cuenoti TaxID=1653831 RepID=UPI00163D0962|nr:translation elongation factor Ts [Blattabacterium cuenoti]
MKSSLVDKIKKLRKITGIGFMDCKIALIKTNENFDKAIFWLKTKGEKIALNRSFIETKEGGVISSITMDHTIGTIIGLSCETDFLSKSRIFLKFLNFLSKHSLLFKNKKEFLSSLYKKQSIQDLIFEKMGIIGEKLELKIFERIESLFVMNYTHHNNKIATLIGFNKNVNNNIAKNIAMHITAMNPITIDKDKIPNDLIKQEIEIIHKQIKIEKLPYDKKEKIVSGKLKKFISENTLLNQKFIKNNKITIKEYLKKSDKNIKINFFIRKRI